MPTRELERRWGLIRTAMEQRGIDVLLAQANNDFMGGYVKYLTDLPATNGYGLTVVFPRDEPMTVIGQGAFGLDQRLPPEGDGVRRGVGRLMGVPSYASATSRAACSGSGTSSAAWSRTTVRVASTVGAAGPLCWGGLPTRCKSSRP